MSDPKARRWIYLGIEVHYGQRYHMWENSYSGRRFAWYVPYYMLATSRPELAYLGSARSNYLDYPVRDPA